MGYIGQEPTAVPLVASDISDDAIDSQHYAAGSIDTAHIADVNVTTGKIANDAITLAKMAAGTDGNIISYDASGNPVAIATGSDGQVLTSAGAGQPPAFEAAAAGGLVVQVVNVHDGAAATGTTTIPHDTSIPQISEGTEFMTLAITPTNASNKLIIRVEAFHTSSATGKWILGALFQDSTANALSGAMPFYCPAASPSTIGSEVIIQHYMTAGTTSATTFRYRAGTDHAATISFNGQSGNVRFGGTLCSSITIWEIAV